MLSTNARGDYLTVNVHRPVTGKLSLAEMRLFPASARTRSLSKRPGSKTTGFDSGSLDRCRSRQRSNDFGPGRWTADEGMLPRPRLAGPRSPRPPSPNRQRRAQGFGGSDLTAGGDNVVLLIPLPVRAAAGSRTSPVGQLIYRLSRGDGRAQELCLGLSGHFALNTSPRTAPFFIESAFARSVAQCSSYFPVQIPSTYFPVKIPKSNPWET